ncbi:DNA-binding transcriptional regulator, MarR family [Ruminococcus flavefaciens]|uniref:DNA-binding transcriptional regulator, MarR family n=1 Tax=Ruminococcus flavefaciens TaxID=1265 RepID=A0A1H6KJ19_RUMFL|nr:MarR family transcriptional regulator [Ruminococcus flavefaciens]SEH71534.1 DNA-binding transcriptional regulator, MarR family [Ruminococcus flavefaciens]
MENKEYLAALAGCEKKYDSLYRGAAAAFGLSDCSMWVLYYLQSAEEPLSQQDLIELMLFPKQTINSAVAGLAKNGYVTLEMIPNTKNRKRILLTDEGRAFAERTVLRMIHAEERAVSEMSDIKRFVTLYEEFFKHLHNEFEREGLCDAKG